MSKAQLLAAATLFMRQPPPSPAAVAEILAVPLQVIEAHMGAIKETLQLQLARAH